MSSKKETSSYDFLSAWKVDDKDWMKERRVAWKTIEIQLNRIKESYDGLYDHLPKKNYKYLKSYFLTGRDKPKEYDEGEITFLKGYDNQYEADFLLQFWLSADHSKEYLCFLKQSFEQEYDKKRIHYTEKDWLTEKLKRSYIYERSCSAYRRTVCNYNGTDKYKWTGETNEYNGPVFGELEDDMRELFSYTPRQIIDLDERVTGNGGTGVYRNTFEYALAGYFGSTKEKDVACFNPHNPIRYLLDEYERWGVPARRRDVKDRRPFIASTALAWHVVDTPEGRHPIQVEVAKELKQRITDLKKRAPNETRERIGNAIKVYETGKFKQYL